MQTQTLGEMMCELKESLDAIEPMDIASILRDAYKPQERPIFPTKTIEA
jgi:hypothetical protein